MHQVERAAIERVAERILRQSADQTIEGAALSRHGYDLELLRELIDAYGRLPDAERRFDFWTHPNADGKNFDLRIRRRSA